MSNSWPTFAMIEEAATRVRRLANQTPVVPSFGLSRAIRADVRLKLETTQPTRAFKVRGAANVILACDEIDPSLGVVTYSTGNHGRAVTYVASRLGLPATVCLSHNTTADKQAALKRMGAEIRLVGKSQDEAAEVAQKLATDGYLMVDPINDPLTTSGQGTIGLELMRQWPDVDTVVVPVSGGALMAGVALAVKSINKRARLVGVSMDKGAAMYESLQAGKPVAVPEVESLADSLQGGIGVDNHHSFEMVRDLVDDLVLVTEDQIALAMAEAVIEERIILEGAGATPIAALLHKDRALFGENVALIASGAMVDTQTLTRVVEDNMDTVSQLLQTEGD